jgi:hypothetical protein
VVAWYRYTAFASWARTTGITLALLDMAKHEQLEASMDSMCNVLGSKLQADDSYALTLLQKRKSTGEITSECRIDGLL